MALEFVLEAEIGGEGEEGEEVEAERHHDAERPELDEDVRHRRLGCPVDHRGAGLGGEGGEIVVRRIHFGKETIAEIALMRLEPLARLRAVGGGVFA